MKKLLCLILAAALIYCLFYNGILTADKLGSWTISAITWSIDSLTMLLNQLTSPDAANKEDILLVNASHPLPDGYDPGPLVRLYDQKRHFLLARDDLYLTKEAFEAANRMFKAAEDQGLNGFIVTSAYRSHENQEKIYAESAAGLAQAPGCSEHQTGLAFDVTARHDTGSFEDTEQCRWIMKNCWEYGFIQRYPEGKEHITGIDYEPWHYRYVGVEAAREIQRRRITLEEYLGS